MTNLAEGTPHGNCSAEGRWQGVSEEPEVNVRVRPTRLGSRGVAGTPWAGTQGCSVPALRPLPRSPRHYHGGLYPAIEIAGCVATKSAFADSARAELAPIACSIHALM